jgi:GAF domain-containing protein
LADDLGYERTGHQAKAAAAFVELVDALVDDFDVIDMLSVLSTRCVELLGAAAAGILLADGEGTLRVIGASNERARLLELLQLQNHEGPCLDCYRTGNVVINPDMASASSWPRFASTCVREGYPSVCAVPMRLKGLTMGSLNLFMSEPVRLPDSDVALAQGLADVASIAIIQDQTARESAVRESQLHRALDSRIVIEQAKGMIAAHTGLDMDAAFSRLRTHARNNNRMLTDLATEIVGGSITLGWVAPRVRPAQPPPGPNRDRSGGAS